MAKFAWQGPMFFRAALPCSDGYHLERGWMLLRFAVGVNFKRAQILKIRAQVSSIRAKVRMLDDCVYVI